MTALADPTTPTRTRVAELYHRPLMALLAELIVMVLVIGIVGGLVAALAERTSRPGSLTIREIVATAFAAGGRATRSRSGTRAPSRGRGRTRGVIASPNDPAATP